MVGERSAFYGYSTWVGVVPKGEEAMDRILGVCEFPPNPDPSNYSSPGEIDAFSSFHMAGTQFLLADGSVRWVRQEIDLDVCHGLATRFDAEVINEF